jgi:hypothetical protein
MEPLQYTATLTDFTDSTAFSALPDAPVVEPRQRRARLVGPRLRLARSLHRVADAVAPAPAPRRAFAGGR